MKKPEKHAKVLQISMEQMLELFFLMYRGVSSEPYLVPKLENILQDVSVRKVWYDQARDTFNFWLEHPSFPTVLEYTLPEYIELEYEVIPLLALVQELPPAT